MSNDPLNALRALHRPRLLIRAARAGLRDYRRNRDLKRLVGELPPGETAVRRLIGEEGVLEAMRLAGAASYSVLRHVEILIALLAEAQSLPRPQPVQVKLSGSEPFRRAM